MNGNPQVHDGSRGAASSMAIGFVLGAVVGAGVALLLAPRSGRETRGRIADTGRRWGAAARTKLERARDVASDLEQDVRSAVEAGRKEFEQAWKSQESHPVVHTELKT